MRAQIFKLIIFIFLPFCALANHEKGKYTKEKKINKSYIVNSNAGLDVTNRYGNIYVTTWDEDKTAIDIIIRVSADKEALLDERLNSISVDIEASKSLVKTMTRIGNFRGKASMEINYTIKIPKKGSIRLTNQYGGITTGKIYSKAEINIQYGDLNIEELNSDNNIINAEYSNNSRIGFLKGGTLSARFSGYNFTKAGKLVANCEYTQLKISDIDDLTYKCDFGNLTIINVDKVAGTSEYMPIKIGKLNTLLNVTTDYGNMEIANITKNVKNIAVNASYAPIKMVYAPDYAFDFEITTEYGGFGGESDLKFHEKREKQFQAYYKGYHKNSGVNRLFINSEFGQISLKQM